MPLTRAADAYRQAAVEHAPPLKILRMLYQGALRFLAEAAALDPYREPAERNKRLQRADAIVCELRCHLAFDVAPELCRELERLYLFVEREITRGLVERVNEPLDNARRVLTTLLDGWKGIELQSEQLV